MTRGRDDPAGVERLADAVRRLIDVTVRIAAPPAAIAAATAAIERVVGELAGFVPSPLPPRYPGGDVPEPNDHFPYDVVLGRRNPLAVPIEIAWCPPRAIGRVVFGTPYEGPPGCVHGAVIASAFDQILNVANVMLGVPGPTAKLMVRYRRPTPLGVPLRFEGWQDRVDGRRIHGAGTLSAGDEVTAEAEGVFVRLSPEHVMRMLDRR